MKTLKLISALFLVAGMLFATGCAKESVGLANDGASVSGVITYGPGTTPAPGAFVWISFGATSASSTQSVRTYTDGNGNFTFSDLNDGNYYISATYTDSHGNVYNSGGCAVVINKTGSVSGANFNLQ